MWICGGQCSPLLNPFTPHSFLCFLFAPTTNSSYPPTTRRGSGCRASCGCGCGDGGKKLSLFGVWGGGWWVVARSSAWGVKDCCFALGRGGEMPRPGPRPYECVRRAWHSERHHSMRGTLIQEMFRVVSELHSSGTKKNKEWQEKLPIVVLKAEEIMYSKANSEGEYMDFKTLGDRLHDSIDAIIRRDETTESETGNLLLPCIEEFFPDSAALVLGCIPRRASRSQQHNNPRCYLNSSPQDISQTPSFSNLSTEKTSYSGTFQICPSPNSSISIPFPQQRPYYRNIVTPSTGYATHFVAVPSSHARKDLPASHTSDFRIVPNSFHHHRQDNALGSSVVRPSSHCHTYPLYYFSNQPNNVPPISEVGHDSQEGIDLNVEVGAWKSFSQTSNVIGAYKETPASRLNLSLQLALPSVSDAQNTEQLDLGCKSAKAFDLPMRPLGGQFVSSSFQQTAKFLFFPNGDQT